MLEKLLSLLVRATAKCDEPGCEAKLRYPVEPKNIFGPLYAAGWAVFVESSGYVNAYCPEHAEMSFLD